MAAKTEEDAVKRGDWKIITVDGEKLRAVYLGSGHYARAYRVQDTVYCFVRQDDYMKEMVSNCQSMKHIPEVKGHGEHYERGQYYNVYSMPYYEPLTARHTEAWKQYRILQREHEAAKTEIRNKKGFQSWSVQMNELNYALVERLSQLPSMASMVDALEHLASNTSNYGSGFGFEFSTRNLGVDKDQNLILRDICFDQEKISQERLKQHEHSRDYHYAMIMGR